MLGIVETEGLADMSYCEGLLVEEAEAGSQKSVGNDVFGRATSLGFYKFAKIFWGVVALVRKVGHGGETLGGGEVGQIVIEHLGELTDHGVVNLLSCNELTVVETEAIVEQKLDVANNEFARVAVDASVQLLVYHVQHATEDVYFAQTEVKGLVGCIVEEFVASHVAPQSRSAE